MTRISVPLAAGKPLLEATFTTRPQQFVVEALLEGQSVQAYMADRGRLLDLLYPGARLLLAPRTGGKLAFQAVAVYAGEELVSLDTHLPNSLLAAALYAKALPQFAQYSQIQAERKFDNHRFDFWLRSDGTSCILEVKSVTCAREGLALFPDAPTLRGRRQLEALTTRARNGQRTALVFVVQRSSAQAVAPDETIDPRFAQALRQAMQAGVELYAYRCPLSLAGISLGEALPVAGSLAAVDAYV